SARVGLGKVSAREQQARAVVGEVVVDRPGAKPLEARVRDAVYTGPVDVAGERVYLLPGGRRAGALRGRGAPEVDPAEVVRERLERVHLAVGDRRALRGRLVPEADVVVEELSPRPCPLRDVV